KGHVFFFCPSSAGGEGQIVKKWKINFEEKTICQLYSEENAVFSFSNQFIQEDYIYSKSHNGQVGITDAHTGKPIAALAELNILFDAPVVGSTPVKQIKPGKGCVAFLCQHNVIDPNTLMQKRAYTIEVLDFTKKRKQPLEIFQNTVLEAVVACRSF